MEEVGMAVLFVFGPFACARLATWALKARCARHGGHR